MKPRHRRFAWIGGAVLLLAVAVGLVLNAFQSNLVFFFSPSDIAENRAPQGRAFRIGGMVVEKSVARAPDGLTVRFNVTDTGGVAVKDGSEADKFTVNETGNVTATSFAGDGSQLTNLPAGTQGGDCSIVAGDDADMALVLPVGGSDDLP